MKAKFKLMLTAMATLLLCVVALTVHGQRKEQSRTVWEYRVDSAYSSDLALTSLGQQGWELVAVETQPYTAAGPGITTVTKYYFKRPK